MNSMQLPAASLVPFDVYRLKQAKAIWLNRDLSGEFDDEHVFLTTFAYATGSPVLPDSALDKNTSLVAYAERYGGEGIGTNGGGARCGNFNGYQVKGNGPNPLVGERSETSADGDRTKQQDDLWHSYGGYSLRDAALEAINTVVLNEVLPLGAANCVGIIETGEDTALMFGLKLDDPFIRAKGALLVREAVMRPAHLLPADKFRIKDQFRHVISSDLHRTRQANRHFAGNLGTPDAFVQYLGLFLKNCAIQFSFAKLFRIYHSAVSAANMAIDGRWLDLTNCCFLEANRNYFLKAMNFEFYREHLSPLPIVKDLTYQYSKFNKVDVNVAPLEAYYHKLFRAYEVHHFASVLGISDYVNDEIKTSEPYLRLLSEFLVMCRSDETMIEHEPKEFDLYDPAVPFLEELFLPPDTGGAKSASSEHLQTVLKACYEASDGSISWKSFLRRAHIRTLVQVHYRPLFHWGKTYVALEKQLATGDSEPLGNIVEQYKEFAKWIFDRNELIDEEERHVALLFKYRQLTILYCCNTELYEIRENGASRYEGGLAGLRDAVQSLDASEMTFNQYPFKPVLLAILSALGD